MSDRAYGLALVFAWVALFWLIVAALIVCVPGAILAVMVTSELLLTVAIAIELARMA